MFIKVCPEMPLPFPLLVEGVFSLVRFEEVEHGHKGERFGIARSGRLSELAGFVSIVEPFLTVPYSGSSTGSRPFIKETARDMRDGKSFLCDPQRKTG